MAKQQSDPTCPPRLLQKLPLLSHCQTGDAEMSFRCPADLIPPSVNCMELDVQLKQTDI